MTDNYFRWLVDQVDGQNSENFLYVLSTIDYIWDIELDGARSDCGVDLRRQYLDEKRLPSNKWPSEGPASVLEVLISLAYKGFHDILYEPGNNIHDGASAFFWEMIDNAGFTYILDDEDGGWLADSSDFSERMIRRNINKILTHRYSFNGSGSFFPLKRNVTNSDMRKQHLYQQMQLYISEKYE